MNDVSAGDSEPDRDHLHENLDRFGQTQVLRFWDELGPAGRRQLAGQIAEVDLPLIADLVSGKDDAIDFGELARRAELPPAVASDGSGAAWTVEQARQRGEAALAAGQVACVLVAGGQGTRLGFDQPKGMFPIGPVSGRTLFQFFADRLIATERRYGRRVPLFLMTSSATDQPTRDYFAEHDNLGLAGDQVTIFQQGTMPAVDAETGQLLLADKDSLALSPDGHGGTLRALDRHGCLDAMLAAGVTHLFYFQVDNPLVELCDPVFIGHHLLAESELTTQVIRKRYATEKVGNLVQVDGRTRIIEYSDLPDDVAAMTDAAGDLKLWAGNIAVHLFDLAFLDSMRSSVTAMPFHRASKKVPFVDDSGQIQDPDSPNAIKFERFIFDLLPSATRTIVCEVDPAEAFAPVKNANGSPTDTPELAKAAIVDLHRRWLTAAGVAVAPGVCVEINPRLALDSASLADKINHTGVVQHDHYFDA